jgi:K+ potassium transporter C-terminal domain
MWISFRGAGHSDFDEFIAWLETTAFSPQEGELNKLLTSLDTLDQQLLTGIEENESLRPEVGVEEFLQSLWRNMSMIFQSVKSVGLELVMEETSFILGRETIVPIKGFKKDFWRARLFSFMARNAMPIT